jgi:hypothetical protein
VATFVTASEARQAATRRGMTRVLAESQLRKAASAPATGNYDIFLSHSHEDAELVAGAKEILEAEGLKVYVYWIEDNASAPVTAATAANLRNRMNHCATMIYASSQSSPTSRWMPWELGYFDGRKPGHVAIMPLPASSTTFAGQEYLKLYPNIERVSWDGGRTSLGISTGPRTARTLSQFVRVGAGV